MSSKVPIKAKKYLDLPHPVEIGLLKSSDHAVSRFPSLDSTLFSLFPAPKRGRLPEPLAVPRYSVRLAIIFQVVLGKSSWKNIDA